MKLLACVFLSMFLIACKDPTNSYTTTSGGDDTANERLRLSRENDKKAIGDLYTILEQRDLKKEDFQPLTPDQIKLLMSRDLGKIFNDNEAKKYILEVILDPNSESGKEYLAQLKGRNLHLLFDNLSSDQLALIEEDLSEIPLGSYDQLLTESLIPKISREQLKTAINRSKNINKLTSFKDVIIKSNSISEKDNLLKLIDERIKNLAPKKEQKPLDENQVKKAIHIFEENLRSKLEKDGKLEENYLKSLGNQEKEALVSKINILAFSVIGKNNNLRDRVLDLLNQTSSLVYYLSKNNLEYLFDDLTLDQLKAVNEDVLAGLTSESILSHKDNIWEDTEFLKLLSSDQYIDLIKNIDRASLDELYEKLLTTNRYSGAVKRAYLERAPQKNKVETPSPQVKSQKMNKKTFVYNSKDYGGYSNRTVPEAIISDINNDDELNNAFASIMKDRTKVTPDDLAKLVDGTIDIKSFIDKDKKYIEILGKLFADDPVGKQLVDKLTPDNLNLLVNKVPFKWLYNHRHIPHLIMENLKLDFDPKHPSSTSNLFGVLGYMSNKLTSKQIADGINILISKRGHLLKHKIDISGDTLLDKIASPDKEKYKEALKRIDLNNLKEALDDQVYSRAVEPYLEN